MSNVDFWGGYVFGVVATLITLWLTKKLGRSFQVHHSVELLGKDMQAAIRSRVELKEKA